MELEGLARLKGKVCFELDCSRNLIDVSGIY